MSKTPRVSVVMANYNYGRYLRSAIDSVLRQTMGDLELIVVDDGSTDNSSEIIKSYDDPRLKYAFVRHLGQPGAKNTGIDQARAPLIAFLDADDVWRRRKLEKQLALFDRDPKLGVVYSRRLLISSTGRPIEYQQPALHRGHVLPQMVRDNFVCFSSAVVRRMVLDHLGRFDTSIDLAIDYDLWLRVADHYRFDYVDEPLVRYRTGHGNLSQRVGERLKTALLLLRRFERRGGPDRIPQRQWRKAQADTACHMGVATRVHNSWEGLRWYGRSLAHDWRHIAAWRGLASCLIPQPVRQRLRRMLGKADWEQAYRGSESPH